MPSENYDLNMYIRFFVNLQMHIIVQKNKKLKKG